MTDILELLLDELEEAAPEQAFDLLYIGPASRRTNIAGHRDNKTAPDPARPHSTVAPADDKEITVPGWAGTPATTPTNDATQSESLHSANDTTENLAEHPEAKHALYSCEEPATFFAENKEPDAEPHTYAAFANYDVLSRALRLAEFTSETWLNYEAHNRFLRLVARVAPLTAEDEPVSYWTAQGTTPTGEISETEREPYLTIASHRPIPFSVANTGIGDNGTHAGAPSGGTSSGEASSGGTALSGRMVHLQRSVRRQQHSRPEALSGVNFASPGAFLPTPASPSHTQSNYAAAIDTAFARDARRYDGPVRML